MMNEEVRRIMTTHPVVVNPNENVTQVSDMMKANRLHNVPVVEFGKLVGIFSLHDLLVNPPNSSDASELRVKQVMNTKVVKVAPIDKVGTAAELFIGKKYKSLPVVNLRNELKGVVTVFDLLKHGILCEYKTPILFEEAFTQ